MAIKDKFLLAVRKFKELKTINKVLIGLLVVGVIVFIILSVTGVINLPGVGRASGASSDKPESYNESNWEYKVVFDKKSWDTHYTDAQAWGGNLLSITCKEEEDVVSTLIAAQATRDGAYYMWIGGQYKEGSSDMPPKSTVFGRDCPEGKFCTDDAGTDKYWGWVDGTPWTYANWRANDGPENPRAEPNNAPGSGYTSEKCVQLSVLVTDGAFDPVFDKTEGSYGNWNDNSCGRNLAAVYKRRIA